MGNNSQFFSSDEVIKRWQIKPFDLLTLIKKTKTEKAGRKYVTIRELDYERDDNGFEWGFTELETKDLKNIYFKKSVIEAYEEKHPQYKPQDAPYISPKDETQPYLDPKNTNYAPELALAVKTWLAVFHGEQKPSRQTPAQRIENYLASNPETKGKSNLIDRLKIVCNPKKRNGRK